jgi:oxygen-dependent protoporphyrinogen oxidase
MISGVDRMPQVVVVGGGMAGLSAAYELHRQAIPFLLLEASSRVGGVVFSEPVDGFTIDAGPDSLLVQKAEGIALCQELGLGDRLVSTKLPRLAYVQRDGRLHALPAASVLGIPTRIGPFISTGLFSWRGKLRMGAEIFVPRRHGSTDESIGAFMTRRFGQEATTYLAEPLLAGIHAGDVNRLSMRALFPRLTEAERTHGSVLRAFRQSSRTVSSEGAFRSLPNGLSELVSALTDFLPKDAVRVRASVTRLARGASGFAVETKAGEVFHPQAVVLATPAFATAGILRDLDRELSRLCDEIPYASAGTIAMAFERDAVRDPLKGSGFVVPRVENTGITAGSWLSSKWPHRAPEGKVLLRAFVGGARDPRAIERSDAELVDVALGALRPILGITGKPLLTRVYRWERANAQHEVGHLDRMAAIDRALIRVPGLFVSGSGFRGVGIPDVVADGRATARRVSAWLASHHVPSDRRILTS